MIAAEQLRQIAADISTRCLAGDFGSRHSLLRARMDAHAVAIWAAATTLETARAPTRREIEGHSVRRRLAGRVRAMLGLRAGIAG